ncbi:MAG: tRNA (adenosine(37)-N6)-dimethylallyltransferase MiaA [Cytophagales bacterium]|nr:tRNA (adenosine(37)-N6)-dimethylallyltransferase MiaA [Cytophagales bacterium]
MNLQSRPPSIPKLIVLLGATGTGKTQVALQIAKRMNMEILSVDSRQVYQEMSLGTAQPPPEEQDGIKHHLIGSQPLSQTLSAGQFSEKAHEKLKSLIRRQKRILIVGGSGFYIQALCEGLPKIPQAPSEIRKKWEEKLKTQKGIEELKKFLHQHDPIFCQRTDEKNLRRWVRAAEVIEVSGRPFSSFLEEKGRLRTPQQNFRTFKIGLKMNRKELYDRLNKRVDHMINKGLEKEVKKLLQQKIHIPPTIGYQEWTQYFEGKQSREKTIDLIKQKTRQYAKRQISWFKRDKNIRWFFPHEIENMINCLKHEMNP